MILGIILLKMKVRMEFVESCIGVKELTNILSEANHVYDVQISERVSKEVLEEFKARLGANKPKKGKKKGKKKKKK